MNTEIVREKPVYWYEACYNGYDGMEGYEIKLYMDDVLKAKIGETWTVEDQDQYPNRHETWTVETTKVYEDASGVLLIEKFDKETVKMIWVEKRRKD